MKYQFKVGDIVSYYANDGDTGVIIKVDNDRIIVDWENDGALEHDRTTLVLVKSAQKPEVPKASNQRPHAELIKAWAEGADVQYIASDGKWQDIPIPAWYDTNQYRIKPVETTIVRAMFVEVNPTLDNAFNKPNLMLTFDKESNKLISAEIIE